MGKPKHLPNNALSFGLLSLIRVSALVNALLIRFVNQSQTQIPIWIVNYALNKA